MPKRFFKKKVKKAKKKSKDKTQDARLMKLEKFLSPEYKTYSIILHGAANYGPVRTATAANTGGCITVNLFPLPAQGVGSFQRIGSDAAIHRLDCTLTLQVGAGGTNFVRWLIVESMAGTLETPTPAMILDEAIAGTDGYIDYISTPVNELRVDTKGLPRPRGYKAVSKKRYIIHQDLRIPVCSNGDDSVQILKYVKNFKSPYRINSTTDAGTTNANGTWWSMILPGMSTTANNNPYIGGNAKVYYTDL